MSAGSRSIVGSAIIPFRVVFLMWLVFTVDFVYFISFTEYGIIPRQSQGLIGIVTAPLLHGNLQHLLSNTFPLLVLGGVLFYFYYPIAKGVFIRCYVLTNILVWLFARTSIHIGASGLIYGISAFLITYGLFRRDLYSLLISLVIFSFYWYLIYGIIPGQYGVSWESHLLGALVGIYCSFEYRKKKI